MKVSLALAILCCSFVAPSAPEVHNNRYHGLPAPMQEIYKYMRYFYEKQNRAEGTEGVYEFKKSDGKVPSYMTQMIQLRQARITVTSVTVVTSTRYQTCTAVLPDTPRCLTLEPPSPPSSAADTMRPSTDEEEQVTTVPLLLPSCNCAGEEGGHLKESRRTPRLLKEDPPVIVITTVNTVTSTATHTLVDPATTVAITYGGCVPTDAVTTTACVTGA